MNDPHTDGRTRTLVVVLGDQLDAESAAFDGFDPAVDRLWMAEVCGESERVWSSKPRILMVLAAMRHFRQEVLQRGWTLEYTGLDDNGEATLSGQLARDLRRCRPERVVLLQPGNWQVEREILTAVEEAGCVADVRPDRHFLCTNERFAEFADSRKQVRQEYFYRQMRQQHQILLDPEGKPVGGQWNFDNKNRRTFGKDGPGKVPEPVSFAPDPSTREAANAVERHFPDHPGSLANFAFPVTAKQAREELADFIENRLPVFGDVQDAMWTGHPFLYHSLLSASMNLHLLNATGKYIRRMSNYCAACRYNPDRACGEDACPFTTLYWDFLMRHDATLRKNPRMSLQMRNIDRKDDAEKTDIRRKARKLKDGFA